MWKNMIIHTKSFGTDSFIGINNKPRTIFSQIEDIIKYKFILATKIKINKQAQKHIFSQILDSIKCKFILATKFVTFDWVFL